jgi:hypothetical protein
MTQTNDGSVNRHPGDELLDDIADLEEDWKPEPPFDPSDAKLTTADSEEQIELMRRWFLARYCDPAEETPYESREGGYIWVWGGPYDPLEQLQDRFGGIVEDDVIEELVDELYRDVGSEWAPVRSVAEDYYERFDLEFEDPNDPRSRLGARLRQALSVLDLQGPEDIVSQLPSMVFGATISALEAYLWETIAYWAKTSRHVLKGIVSNMSDLKDQQIKLGQIFDEHDGIEKRVMVYLQNVVWHRWDKVGQLFRAGLDVRLPSVRAFQEAIEKRHHIVHRSGHDPEGNPVTVTTQDVRDLADAVEKFADELYGRINDKITESAFND